MFGSKMVRLNSTKLGNSFRALCHFVQMELSNKMWSLVTWSRDPILKYQALSVESNVRLYLRILPFDMIEQAQVKTFVSNIDTSNRQAAFTLHPDIFRHEVELSDLVQGEQGQLGVVNVVRMVGRKQRRIISFLESYF